MLFFVGHLLSCVVKEMVNSVTSLEDMSADDTTKLHHLITQVGLSLIYYTLCIIPSKIQDEKNT